jgi:hypothetical protein
VEIEGCSILSPAYISNHYAGLLIARLSQDSYECVGGQFPLSAVFCAVSGQLSTSDMAFYVIVFFKPWLHSLVGRMHDCSSLHHFATCVFLYASCWQGFVVFFDLHCEKIISFFHFCS